MACKGKGKKEEINMKELERFINKDKQKRFLELFMILDEIGRKENIISFTCDKYYLIIKTEVNDYYRIRLNEEVIKC